MKRTLLLVDDEENILRSVQRLLHGAGYEIVTAHNGEEEALRVMQKTPAQVIVTDQRMPGMTGSELLAKIGELYPDTVRMMLSGYADFQAVITAINQGNIFKFITKPWQDDVLKKQHKSCF